MSFSSKATALHYSFVGTAEEQWQRRVGARHGRHALRSGSRGPCTAPRSVRPGTLVPSILQVLLPALSLLLQCFKGLLKRLLLSPTWEENEDTQPLEPSSTAPVAGRILPLALQTPEDHARETLNCGALAHHQRDNLPPCLQWPMQHPPPSGPTPVLRPEICWKQGTRQGISLCSSFAMYKSVMNLLRRTAWERRCFKKCKVLCMAQCLAASCTDNTQASIEARMPH